MPIWHWPNGSPSMRHCRCKPASASRTWPTMGSLRMRRPPGLAVTGNLRDCSIPRTPRKDRSRSLKNAHRFGRAGDDTERCGMAETYDVVVAGGGHNGLVAACYLAKAGMSVCVVERHERLGGAGVTPRPTPPRVQNDICP